MNKFFLYVLLFFALVTGVVAFGQTDMDAGQIKANLRAINSRMAVLMENKETAELIKYYTNDAVCMPEFYVQLFNKADIRKFYQQFFSVNSIDKYRKDIYEVICENNYFIETGTFAGNLIRDGKEPFPYRGKYLCVWQSDSKGDLKIVSQIWGASNWIDRTTLTCLPRNNNASGMPATAEDPLTMELKAKNQMLRQAVFKSDAKEQIQFYCDDAIYMPYYDSMYIGRQNIDHYFTTHYSPDWFFDSLSFNTSKVMKLKDLIVEYSYYYVRWGNSKKETGIVTGKSINIWRRNEKDELLIYRQMANHD